MLRRALPILAALLLVPLAGGFAAPSRPKPAAAGQPALDPSFLKALAWREVGPYRGGRAAAVEGIASQPLTYYFGATGGGVWKTLDGGASWKNVSDGFFGGSIGAVAVAPSDPNVVYVGGGEVTVRGNVSPGDGMWKSTDAGATWARSGLPDSQHIVRLRVHPQNPDLVYAAVLGHAFGPSDQRGVYRTKDGGKSWQRILFANRDAGAFDLILDPGNPRTLYATTWRFRRMPWGFSSGGAGSALWKSTDGGDTWRDLSKAKGLPTGTLGVLGVAVSPSNPQNLYALVEAQEGGLFRSRDAGLTWTLATDSHNLRQRAWYYSRIYADPRDEETVYATNVQFEKSKDGGKTFAPIRVPHGDNHDLWIAPDDPLRMIESNDGGANVSFDGGRTWSAQDNQPTAQFYRVSTDTAFPYHILGAQQDNSAVRIASRGAGGGIGPRDWQVTAGGESGYIVADPKDPDLVFGGSYGGYLSVLNHRTQEIRDVNPWPDNPMGAGAAELKYRFQWNFPIATSPNDPSALYVGANVLFRSHDRGSHWEVISPDLTKNDKSKQGPTGGPITKDNTSVEYYATIFTIAESPLEAGVIWTGSDDGVVSLTRDDGKSWKTVTPKALPDGAQINAIDASPTKKGEAYVAATRYKLDDFRPSLWKTEDYGATWREIVEGLPKAEFTRVVRGDPGRPGLLYAGTERGIYVSFDDGARWQSLQGKLPVVPVTDLTIKGDDLIVATQGRGFWVLDDLGPLRQMARDVPTQTVHLFAPRPAYRLAGGGGFEGGPARSQGANPPNGVAFVYSLAGVAEKTPLKLELLDAAGKSVRTFKGEVTKEEPKVEAKPAGEPTADATEGPTGMAKPIDAAQAAAAAKEDKAGQEDKGKADKKDKKKKPVGRGGEEPKLEATVGLNRFVWDLEVDKAKDFPGLVLWAGSDGGLDGPRVVPGRYQARLTVGEGATAKTETVPFEILADPRSATTQADLAAQYDFLLSIRDRLSRVHTEIRRIRQVREQLTALEGRAGDGEAAKPIIEAAKALDKKMTAVEEALYQTQNKSPQDPLNYPIRLNDKLALLAGSAGTGDYAPTAQAQEVKRELDRQIDGELGKLQEVWDKDLPALNRQIKESAIPLVSAEVKEEE